MTKQIDNVNYGLEKIFTDAKIFYRFWGLIM